MRDSIDERVVDGRCLGYNSRDSFGVWIENVCISERYSVLTNVNYYSFGIEKVSLLMTKVNKKILDFSKNIFSRKYNSFIFTRPRR